LAAYEKTSPCGRFHDNPGEEFFYELRGDIVLKLAEAGRVYDVPIREGEVFLLPPHLRHSPKRPIPGSVGLVVENARRAGEKDGFRMVLFRLRRAPPPSGDCRRRLRKRPAAALCRLLRRSERAHMRECGSVHPGKAPLPGWAVIPN